MSFRVIGDFKNHYMIQHPDGSSFPVAKKGISDEMHRKIQMMPRIQKLSDGGEVVEPMATPINPENPAISPNAELPPDILAQTQAPTSQPVSIDLSPGSMLTPNIGVPTQYGTNQPIQDPSPAPGVQPDQIPQDLKNLYNKPAQPVQTNPALETGKIPNPGSDTSATSSNDFFSAIPGYNENQAAIKGQAGVMANSAKQMADAQQKFIDDQNKVYNDYQGQLKAQDDKIQSLSNDVQNGKIDPNRVWNNMGTGNKVLAAISVALGGIGSGLTGKSNAALDVINKSIDQDVEAQKAELGNKNNLLSHYMNQYHNIEQAENAAKLHLATIAGAQMQKIAAQSGSASAQYAAQIQLAQLKAQYAPLIQKQAGIALKNQMSGADGGEGGLPQDKERAAYQLLSSLDKDYGAKRVPVDFGNGNVRVYEHTGQPADAEKQRVFEGKLAPITASVQELDKLGPSAVIRGTDAYNKAESIRKGLASSIAGLKSTEIGSTRINNTESDQALEQINDPTSFLQLLGGGKIRDQAFFKDLNNTAESIRKENLVGYKGRPQTYPIGGGN